MKKFEYKAVTIPTSMALTTSQIEKAAREFEARLNALGAEGWELAEYADGLFIFKREMDAHSACRTAPDGPAVS